jgi:hypothetical protein
MTTPTNRELIEMAKAAWREVVVNEFESVETGRGNWADEYAQLLLAALEEQREMWSELRKYLKPRAGGADMDTTWRLRVYGEVRAEMDAIEAKYRMLSTEPVPDDPEEIERRLEEMRGGSDE